MESARSFVEKNTGYGGAKFNCQVYLDNGQLITDYSLTWTEAAALIEDYGRRVPRAMLEDLFKAGIRACIYDEGDPIELILDSVIPTIAAKHGVEVE
jgi:hypothetical protein